MRPRIPSDPREQGEPVAGRRLARDRADIPPIGEDPFTGPNGDGGPQGQDDPWGVTQGPDLGRGLWAQEASLGEVDEAPQPRRGGKRYVLEVGRDPGPPAAAPPPLAGLGP